MTNEERADLLRAGAFPRIVTHDEALQSAKNFINEYFRNEDGKGVLIGIPARPDHDDMVLIDYIEQQKACADGKRIAELEAALRAIEAK